MKIARLAYIGTQKGIGRIAACELYNVIATLGDCPSLAVGSTVTIASVQRAGVTLIVVDKLGNADCTE